MKIKSHIEGCPVLLEWDNRCTCQGSSMDLPTFEPVDPEGWRKLAAERALRIADLERSERELAEQRDHAEEWADKLAEAIALHCREDIGEHSNLNNPWAHAHNLIAGNFCR